MGTHRKRSGVTSVSTIDVEELTDGRIEVNNPLAGKQKITVAVKDETNALYSGLITISGPQQSYEQAITAQPTDIYLPKGTYYIGARITGKEAYYIPIYQEISLADSPIEQTFSYETGKKVTVRVLDMDGLPIENAIVSQLIPSNDYWDGQKTDARGEVTYIATAGTYTYRVLAVIGTDKQSYRSIEGEIVVGSPGDGTGDFLQRPVLPHQPGHHPRQLHDRPLPNECKHSGKYRTVQ